MIQNLITDTICRQTIFSTLDVSQEIPVGSQQWAVLQYAGCPHTYLHAKQIR